MSAGLLVAFLIAAALLLVSGGLLAASDAALGVLSRADLHALAERSPRSASSITTIANDPSPHSNALNFVRVVNETIAAVLITVSLAYSIDNVWLTLLIATLIMVGVTFVLVGSSPRSVGVHRPEAVLRFSAPLIVAFRRLLGPLASALIRMGDRVTPGRGSGVRLRDEQQLLSLVDQAAEQELLEEDEREYIHSVMEFRQTVVREVMVPRTAMVTVAASASVKEALEVMLSSRHSRIPVMSEDVDDIVGVLYLRDTAKHVLRRPDEAESDPVTKIMKPAQFVPESQKTDELLREMQREANHLALVVDEYGGIDGLVTLEDLLEEIVGEIVDEHDREASPVQSLGEGAFRVSARVAVDELGELFGLELGDDDVDTVGGLFVKALGRLADVDDTVVVSGIELLAVETERKRQQLVSVIARPAPRPEESTPHTSPQHFPAGKERTSPPPDQPEAEAHSEKNDPQGVAS